MKIFYTYILYNTKFDKYYIGSTNNIEDRLNRHNKGQSKATKSGVPFWIVAYFETFDTRSLAMKREYQLKRMKSKKYLKALIENAKTD